MLNSKDIFDMEKNVTNELISPNTPPNSEMKMIQEKTDAEKVELDPTDIISKLMKKHNIKACSVVLDRIEHLIEKYVNTENSEK